MSVEKMEKYKEYKKHRKEILRKQKRRERLVAITSLCATVVVLGFIAFFIYQDVKPEYKFDSRTLIDWNKYIPEDTVEEEEDAEGEATESDTDAEEATDASAEDVTTESDK